MNRMPQLKVNAHLSHQQFFFWTLLAKKTPCGDVRRKTVDLEAFSFSTLQEDLISAG